MKCGRKGGGILSGGSWIGSGTNIAVISSGASLASAVTATSFLDGLEPHDDAHTRDGDDDGASGRSDDGDVEDEGDNAEEEEHDGSASSEFFHRILFTKKKY